MRRLTISDMSKEIHYYLNFLIENDVIPGDLEIGLAHAKRSRAIDEFNSMLELDLTENNWQNWFETNSWVLGTDFVKVLDERTIDTANISDFLMQIGLV